MSLTITTACECFNKSPLYTHTKKNSLRLVVSLIPGLIGSKPKGYLHTSDGIIYNLANVRYLECWNDIMWQTLIIIKKAFYAFLLLFPLHYASYIVYESLVFYRQPSKILLRVAYVVLVCVLFD